MNTARVHDVTSMNKARPNHEGNFSLQQEQLNQCHRVGESVLVSAAVFYAHRNKCICSYMYSALASVQRHRRRSTQCTASLSRVTAAKTKLRHGMETE